MSRWAEGLPALLGEEGQVDADDGEDEDQRPEEDLEEREDDVERDGAEHRGADGHDQLGQEGGAGVGSFLPEEEEDGETDGDQPEHEAPPCRWIQLLGHEPGPKDQRIL